jgi:hypothetical protein
MPLQINNLQTSTYPQPETPVTAPRHQNERFLCAIRLRQNAIHDCEPEKAAVSKAARNFRFLLVRTSAPAALVRA